MFTSVTDDISIGGQPEEKDLEKIAEFGFKSVINLRDASEEGTIDNATEERILADNGIKYINIPVIKNDLNDDLVKKVSNHITELSNNNCPLLIHCGTGKRAGAMALLHLAIENSWNLDESFDKARKLGFDCESEPEMKVFFESYIRKYSQGKH